MRHDPPSSKSCRLTRRTFFGRSLVLGFRRVYTQTRIRRHTKITVLRHGHRHEHTQRSRRRTRKTVKTLFRQRILKRKPPLSEHRAFLRCSAFQGGPCSASGSSARTAAPDASMHLSGLSCVEASNGRARVQNHRSTSPTPSSPKPCANTSVCTSGAATPTSPTPPSFLLATATPPHPNASELGVAPGTTLPWDSPTLGAVGPPHIATPGGRVGGRTRLCISHKVAHTERCKPQVE